MNEENIPEAPLSTQPSTWKSVVKEIIIFAIIAFGIVLPFRAYIAEPYVVDGASMDPTFHTGDYLIVNKLSYELGTPKRNTVIVFKYPDAPLSKDWIETLFGLPPSIHVNFIKRVIGLPGDTLTMKNNVLKITNAANPQGVVIDESYIVDVCHTEKNNCISTFQKTLGPDEYFVMGDNRSESFDSRYWGVVPAKDILGEPVVQLWPLLKIAILPGNDTK